MHVYCVHHCTEHISVILLVRFTNYHTRPVRFSSSCLPRIPSMHGRKNIHVFINMLSIYIISMGIHKSAYFLSIFQVTLAPASRSYPYHSLWHTCIVGSRSSLFISDRIGIGTESYITTQIWKGKTVSMQHHQRLAVRRRKRLKGMMQPLVILVPKFILMIMINCHNAVPNVKNRSQIS